MSVTDDVSKKLATVLDRPVVLTGMMGAGKSHVGKILSERLGMPWYDSDAEIEAEQGRVISDIFKQDGEACFRALEQEKIEDLLSGGVCILSVGGGAVTTPEVLSAIKERALSVWLDAPLDDILARTAHKNTRPLLDCDDPAARLKALMEVRRPLYVQADFHIESAGNDPYPVVRNIEKALYAHYHLA